MDVMELPTPARTDSQGPSMSPSLPTEELRKQFKNSAPNKAPAPISAVPAEPAAKVESFKDSSLPNAFLNIIYFSEFWILHAQLANTPNVHKQKPVM